MGQGMLLLVYPDRLVAVDARTGNRRWGAATAFASDHVTIEGERVIACDLDGRRFNASVYETATGRLIWNRQLPSSLEPLFWSGPRGIAVAGDNLYAIGHQKTPREEVSAWTIRLSDGTIIGQRTLLPPGSGETRYVATDGLRGCAQAVGNGGGDWRFHWFDLAEASPPAEARIIGTPKRPSWEYVHTQVEGDLVYITMRDSDEGRAHYVLPLRGTAQAARNTAPCFVRGDKYYTIANHTVKAVRLQTQTAVGQYTVPPRPEPDEYPVILDVREQGGRLVVVTATEQRAPAGNSRKRNPRHSPSSARKVELNNPRVDLFDLATGGHLAGAELGEIDFWKPTEFSGRSGRSGRQSLAVVFEEGLVLAGRNSIHVFGREASRTPTHDPTEVLTSYRRSAPAGAQGEEESWPMESLVVDGVRRQGDGRVRISHDDEEIRIAVSYQDDAIAPRRGRREFSTGDWLDVSLRTNLGLCRFGAGLDASGRVVLENLCDGELPRGMRCVARQDIAGGQHIYEISIPLREILHKSADDSWRGIGVRLVVWEDASATGSRPVLRFGSRTGGGSPALDADRPLRLHPLSVDEDRTATAIIERMSDLAESRRLAQSLRRPMPATRPTGTTRPGPAEDLAFLEVHVPRLGATEAGLMFFRVMLGLEGTDSARVIARYKWYLKLISSHPRAADILGELLNYRRKINWQADGFMDAVMEECRIPLRTRYDYRRRFLSPKRSFLLEWQAIGPFLNASGEGLETPYPPEIDRIRLDASYPGIVEPVRWRHIQATRQNNLTKAMRLGDNTVVYLACWIRNPTARGATLELNANDGVKVWLARRPVYSGADTEGTGNHRVALFLPAGWSELLIKVPRNSGDWEFRAELVDPEGRGPLSDVQISTTPP